MTQQNFIAFILVAAVFLAGASIGQLLLRVRLARLERINRKLDRKRLDAFARALHSRAALLPRAGDDKGFERRVRHEIDSILTEIEKN
ncbi:MAG TPA: hypothetical protein VHO02_00800 [Fibrobacteria bacterium]|jgi:hypothetical protein|nr:hypothetical protein [Fibrobacteria bacterium]